MPFKDQAKTIDLGWKAEFFLKIALQFSLGKNRSKINFQDHAEIPGYQTSL